MNRGFKGRILELREAENDAAAAGTIQLLDGFQTCRWTGSAAPSYVLQCETAPPPTSLASIFHPLVNGMKEVIS